VSGKQQRNPKAIKSFKLLENPWNGRLSIHKTRKSKKEYKKLGTIPNLKPLKYFHQCISN